LLLFYFRNIGYTLSEIKKRRNEEMKRIFSIAISLLMLLAFVGCSKEGGENAEKETRNIMELERISRDGNRALLSVKEFQTMCLENPYGFAIKVKVTEKYENVLLYEEYPILNTSWAKKFIGYDDLPRDKYGRPIDVSLSGNSYILTDVLIQRIYYMGENISFEVNDIISLAEECFIFTVEGWSALERANGGYYGDGNYGDEMLYIYEDWLKLEPGKEYLIFGHKSMLGEEFTVSDKYCSIGFWESTVDTGIDAKSEPVRLSIPRTITDTSEEYYKASNAEQVIRDYIEDYREFLKTTGYIDEWWQ